MVARLEFSSCFRRSMEMGVEVIVGELEGGGDRRSAPVVNHSLAALYSYCRALPALGIHLCRVLRKGLGYAA